MKIDCKSHDQEIYMPIYELRSDLTSKEFQKDFRKVGKPIHSTLVITELVAYGVTPGDHFSRPAADGSSEN